MADKDCETTFKAPLVQLINKKVSGGRPEAVTLSDGLSVSPNVDPLNEEMADELNQIPLFDFLEINNAFVKGDRITLSDFEHKRIQTKAGVHLPISGPLTGPSVEKLEMISPRSLQLWGIRFPEEEEVTFSARATTANLDATIIASDQVIAEVGQTDPRVPQPTEPKRRKLIQCPICRPSRTFTDEEKLAQHMSVFHIFYQNVCHFSAINTQLLEAAMLKFGQV